MKIKVSRLREIIKEEVFEARLRQKIRNTILELSGTASAAKTQLKRGEVSAATRTAKSDEGAADTAYKSAQSDYSTAQTTTKNAKASLDKALTTRKSLDPKKYRKKNKKVKGGYDYSDRAADRTWDLNPEWVTADKDYGKKEK